MQLKSITMPQLNWIIITHIKTFMNHYRKKIFIVTQIVVLFLLACSQKQNTPPEKTTVSGTQQQSVTLTEKQFQNAGIETQLPLQQQVTTTILVNGTVDVPPQSMISVSSNYGGILKDITVLPGSHVKQGEVIARLEDPVFLQLQQEYLATKIKHTLLDKERQRQTELYKTEATSGRNVEQTEAEYKTILITEKTLSEKLLLIGINPKTLTEETISRSITIRSSINGFVSKVTSNIGKYIQSGETIAEIVNPSDIHASLNVFEKDLPTIAIGQTVRITLPNIPNDTHSARIILISQNINENRNAIVHCHFDNRAPHVLPGMFLQAAINTPSTTELTVPETSIVQDAGKQYVFVETGNRTYTMVQVQQLQRVANMVAIRSAVTLQSSKVVGKGAFMLLSSMKRGDLE